MTTLRNELINYITSPILAGSALYLYNVFVNKQSMQEDGIFLDSVYVGVAELVSKLLDDVLQNNVDLKQFSGLGMLFKPIVTGFVYAFLYKQVWIPQFNTSGNRDVTNNFMIGAVVNIVTSWV